MRNLRNQVLLISEHLNHAQLATPGFTYFWASESSGTFDKKDKLRLNICHMGWFSENYHIHSCTHSIYLGVRTEKSHLKKNSHHIQTTIHKMFILMCIRSRQPNIIWLIFSLQCDKPDTISIVSNMSEHVVHNQCIFKADSVQTECIFSPTFWSYLSRSVRPTTIWQNKYAAET